MSGTVICRGESRKVRPSALETIRPLAAGHELIVELPAEPLYLDADPVRLAQVFLNLLTNAVRYTEPGGTIRLSAEREGGELVARVKDAGIGIAPETLPYVFELFAQGARPGRQAQGLGIGLSLVKQLTEMHGGTVAAHSASAGQGSEFIVRLPLAAEQAPAPPKSPAPGKAPVTNSLKRRILVVDDNTDSAEMMELTLTMEEHQIRLAYDGETAIKIALEFQPELIFLDIGLPDIDGYEVAARLRRELPRTLLAALSGWGQEADRLRSQEAGFDRHLVKPLDFDELPELLAAAGRPEH